MKYFFYNKVILSWANNACDQTTFKELEIKLKPDASVAASLLIIYNNVHMNASSSKVIPRKVDRSRIGTVCIEEIWN